MISRIAVEAVTSPDNVAAPDEDSTGLRAVRDDDVVAELRQLEGLGSGQARRLGREAVAHVGGYIEQASTGGRRTGRRRDGRERWWVPGAVVRKP